MSSVYAEPARGESWAEHIVRINTMSDRLDRVYFNNDNWEEKYAAVYATHIWLKISYSHILYFADMGKINLIQYQRENYTFQKEYHTIKAYEFNKNMRFFSESSVAIIHRMYDYWMKHLNDGGTIIFEQTYIKQNIIDLKY
jgi:hypothetical protein